MQSYIQYFYKLKKKLYSVAVFLLKKIAKILPTILSWLKYCVRNTFVKHIHVCICIA